MKIIVREVIKSNQNNIFKKLKSLNQKKYRDEENGFVIEGKKFVSDAPAEFIRFYALSESYVRKKPCIKTDKETYVFSDELFAKLSDAVTPQGILALCSKPDYTLDEIITKYSLFVILEEIGDPGNIGGIIRTAAAANAAVIISKNSADAYGPKALRSTASAVFSAPVVCGADVPDTVRYLSGKGFSVYGSDLSAETNLYKLDYTGPTAFVIGSEARGISPETAGLCHKSLIIPMSPGVDSLNASSAAAIMLYETVRQRSKL